jgi:hypothetical protein
MIQAFLSLFQTDIARKIFSGALLTAPVWVSLLCVFIYFDLWVTYKQRQWLKDQGRFLLEIKLPREMPKSPQAMELFFNSLYNVAVGNFITVYWKGAVRFSFSLELVSIDGQVHFFIYCDKNYRTRIETQLYAQFPGIEVHEVSDYALNVQRDPTKRTIGWIGQMEYTKPDAYPIKTYVDYGLDKDPKEEYKNDPLVHVLEFLGSLKKGEQAWIQIMIRSHSKEGLKYGRFFTKPDWKAGVEKEIKNILKKANLKTDEEKAPSGMHLSEGQKNVITSIERTSAKFAFDTMIRIAYIADNEVYNPGSNIGGLIGSIAQFGSSDLNGFKPGYHADYDYPWQDPTGKKRAENEEKLLEAYKRRSFFSPPFKNFHGKPFVMTTEELATIFHFPGETAATPTLTRLPSKKGQAPTNLPI